MPVPVDGVTLEQAARILGVARSTVQEWIAAGRLTADGVPGEHRRLSRAEVEQLATQVLPDPRQHPNRDPESYWVWGRVAAAVMGISGARLRALASRDLVPFVWHHAGVRMYRREGLLTVANARAARRH